MYACMYQHFFSYVRMHVPTLFSVQETLYVCNMYACMCQQFFLYRKRHMYARIHDRFSLLRTKVILTRLMHARTHQFCFYQPMHVLLLVMVADTALRRLGRGLGLMPAASYLLFLLYCRSWSLTRPSAAWGSGRRPSG